MSKANPRDQAEHALRQANRAAKNGDYAEAERWRKTADGLVKTAQQLAALPPPVDDALEEEARRAELRRRLARFVEASLDIEAWEEERAAYDANFAAALGNGTPPPAPMRPHPAGPQAEEAFLTQIMLGPEEESLSRDS